MIPNNEIKLFNELLDRHVAGLFSNVCSDYELRNTPENLLTIEEMYKFAFEDEPEELKSMLKALERGVSENHLCVDDWMLFDYLRDKIVPKTKE